ncbi:HlyD family efflux transporter periplasmic adaptor subunit [Enterovirga rhinocerotis]|uniref:Multidrug efflux pump subunit AcrA (Membrane-fusion protein) n=1 Tax=Enterovirga rhinocerotis TaxID=1339210 RepID=A0A4R7CDE7_9HYPH|nr:HlyD family efflux transporter periplasmic adaptor subunit [Enterovirga rhinocerotis]TDR94857.1 multidrug efflux pump subunit AcrA (membrane-fusion protein) [Enterovirga rhinocerotis]
MRFLVRAALMAAVLATAPFGGGGAHAHEGHDHGDQPATATPIAPRGSSVTDTLELVAVARSGTLTIHLDRFATNEPVSGATVEVEAPDGSTGTASATEPGSYRIAAPWSEKAGEHEITIVVTADGSTDVFPVMLDIHEPEGAAAPTAKTSWFTTPAFATEIGKRVGQDGVLAVAIGSFLAGIVVALLLRRRSRSAAALVAVLALATPVTLVRAHGNHEAATPASGPKLGSRDQAQRMQDGNLFVPKPTQHLLAVRTLVTEEATHRTAVELPGRIIADPNGSGLVQSAQGGRLSAPPDGFPRLGAPVKKGDILAYATPPVQLVDSSDMMQRQGELDQQIAILEKRVVRFQALAKSNIVSQVQLDEAREELRGLRERREGLDRIRTAPEALISPIDGIVAEVNAVAGQIAQPSAIVFQVIDPKRLLVEALSFEAPSELGDATGRLATGDAFKLRLLGAGLADRNQAVPVHFAIEGDASGLRIGKFVTVTASRADGKAGIAVPRASIVRGGNGQSLVFEKTAPETFEPREVRIDPLDGERVIVAAGIGAGKRVVTDGAELLNQVR